jgi:pSer/pThr/pTyr-binding forkhead associated (FHA) protein
MTDVTLTYSSPDGQQEIAIDREKTTFGRGSEADHRFPDDGLSRLHATVYRDGDRVWVVDENSTNGTLVNGVKVGGSGTPLKNGDIVRIGNHTNLGVKIAERRAGAATVPAKPAAANVASPSPQPTSFHILPIVLIAGAIFIISITSVVVVFTVFGSGTNQIAQRPADDDDPGDDHPSKTNPKDSPTPKTDGPSANSTPTTSSNTDILPNDPGNTGTVTNLPPGKKYADMSDAERRQYLEVKAMRVAQYIGNSSSDKIPPAAIDKIKGFADAYASRAKVKPLSGCRFGDNLQATFERASKNAPFIVKAFNEKGIDPRIGLYLAMIESEHCVCLQSPTGPLGMFQFTKATAELHGLKVFAGASPSNPDERCQPEPAARAAASYMKALTGRYGTGPSSVPLAIGSYNSGEGGLSANLEKALSSGQGLERDFWTLIEKGDILSKQFQAENFKYVPKFFAAAIIGENPQDFGMTLQPISTYSK